MFRYALDTNVLKVWACHICVKVKVSACKAQMYAVRGGTHTLIFRRRGRSRQDRQCAYNVTLRRVRESLLPWESKKYYIFVCVCAPVHSYVFVYVCPGAWVYAWANLRVVLLIQHATRMRHTVTSFVASGFNKCFEHFLKNGTIFGKRSYLI